MKTNPRRMLIPALMLLAPLTHQAFGQDHVPKTDVSVAENAAKAESNPHFTDVNLATKPPTAEMEFGDTEIPWMPTCSALLLMMSAQMASIVHFRRNRKKNYLLTAGGV